MTAQQEVETLKAHIMKSLSADVVIEIEYYPNGNLKSETPYKNNIVNGVQKEYDEKGRIDKEIPYKNGIINGIERIYEYFSSFYDEERGFLSCETPYIDDKKNGVQKEYYSNGDIYAEIPYKNDRKDGIAIFYDEDYIAEPREHYTLEIPYKNDEKEGIALLFCNDNLQAEISYKNDMLHGLIKLYHNGTMFLKALARDGVIKVARYVSGEALSDEGLERLYKSLPSEYNASGNIGFWRSENIKAMYCKPHTKAT